MRLEDIDFQTKKITISRRIYNGNFGSPKNGKIQSIPLHRELEEVIQKQLKLNDQIKKTSKWKKYNHIELFLSTHSGKRVSKHLFRTRLKSLSEIVLGSNEGVSPHTLRRSLSDYLIQSGMNISQVSGMLRNTSVVMLKHYSRQDIDVLSEAFNTMNISKVEDEKNIGK
jgi:site-specific recombinase XerD